MRLVAAGLIEQQPRRGMRVSDIHVAEHLVLIDTRRVLEQLIAAGSARRATPSQRQAIVNCADQMIAAAEAGDLDGYMQADQALDHVNHRSEEHTSELQSLMRISYAVFCLKKKNIKQTNKEKTVNK